MGYVILVVVMLIGVGVGGFFLAKQFIGIDRLLVWARNKAKKLSGPALDDLIAKVEDFRDFLKGLKKGV